MTAGTTAIWSAAAFALLALISSVSERRSEYAGGLLALATAMAAIAVGLLLNAFAGEDLAVRAVAQHSALGLASGQRLLAIWGSPPGAALGAAVVVGITGLLISRKAHTGTVLPAYAAFMCTLVSVPVMQSPLALLGFVPADGLGASLVLQQPVFLLSIVGILTLAATAPYTLGVAVAPGMRSREQTHWRSALMTLVAAGFTVLTWWYATVAAGLSRAQSPLALQSGYGALLVVAMVVGVRILYLAGPRDLKASTRMAGVAVAVAALAMLLAAPSPHSTQRAVQLLAVASALLALIALVLALREADSSSDTTPAALRIMWPGRAVRGAPGVLVLLSLSCTAAALIGSSLTRESRTEVAPGQSQTVATAVTLTHLGISRFEVSGGQIVAVALDRSGTLRQAQRRELVSVRGERLGPLVTPPAMFINLRFTVTVWLEEILREDAVQLTVRVVPLAMLWPVAVVLLLAAAVALFGRKGEPT